MIGPMVLGIVVYLVFLGVMLKHLYRTADWYNGL
jgi:hypothetical protein